MPLSTNWSTYLIRLSREPIEYASHFSTLARISQQCVSLSRAVNRMVGTTWEQLLSVHSSTTKLLNPGSLSGKCFFSAQSSFSDRPLIKLFNLGFQTNKRGLMNGR